VQKRITKIKFIAIAIAIYLVWILATYLLEGRIQLLQRPNPSGRLIYTVVANIIIGTAISIWILKLPVFQRFVTAKQVGFQPSVRRLIVVAVIAGLIGFTLFTIQKPVSLNPIVILNVFSQTLPTSIAELVVCWAVVGTVLESTFRCKSDKIISIILAGLASTILFGIYHFAHSPPFNQPYMILFLMFPGALTSIIYFVGRDIYAAVVFHNFQALFGVMNNMNIEPLFRPMYPVIIMAIVSLSILVLSDLLVIRKTKGLQNA
jgi:CAAX prenyl protease-like protein